MKNSIKLILIIATLLCVALAFTGCSLLDDLKGNIDQLLCEHEFDVIIDTVPSTCTEQGSVTKICTLCKKEVVEKTDLAAHQPLTVPGKASTCVETGLTESTKCFVCNEVITPASVIPVADHTSEIIPAVEATCIQVGFTASEKCSVCDKILVASKMVPVTDHKPIRLDDIAPTCTEGGYIDVYRCEYCGHTSSTAVPATGHNLVTYDEDVEPTCTEVGYSAGTRCDSCDYVVSGTVIPALGHDETLIQNGTPATCTESGTANEYICERCHIKTRFDVIPSLHDSLAVGEQCSSCGEYKLVDIAEVLAGDYTTAELVVGESITSGSMYRMSHEASAEFNVDGYENIDLFITGFYYHNYIGYLYDGSYADALVIYPNEDEITGLFDSLLTEEGIAHVTGLSIYDDGTYVYICFYGDVFASDAWHDRSPYFSDSIEDLKSMNLSAFTFASKSGDVVRVVW